MRHTWRVLDTGLRPAAENIALNRALLEARQAGEAPNTLRFLRFTPCALLGFHQSAEQELNLDYCKAQGITVQRRITGGGAIYFDEGQLGWELYLHKRDTGTADMTAISRRICEAAARGISALGVTARYRPRNDIEVEGKKISGTGGAFDGDALMFQGTLLVQFDVEKMLRVLHIPAEKLSGKAVASARERVTSLAELLGHAPDYNPVKERLSEAFSREFNVRFEKSDLRVPEQARFANALHEVDNPDWVNLIQQPSAQRLLCEAFKKFPGGLLRANVAFDIPSQRIKQVWIMGDFFVSPRRAVADLEAALRDVPLEHLRGIIIKFFRTHDVDMFGLKPDDFAEVIETAIALARPACDRAVAIGETC